jgi:MFS family permease
MAFYSTLAGIGGTLFVGPFLDRTLRYRVTNWTLFIITFLSLLLTCVFLEIKSWLGVYISVMIYGVFSYALTPVVFQYSVVKYPHRDEMVLTGILNVSNTVVGIALIYILSAPGLNNIIPDAVAPYFPMRWGSWVIVILNFVCLLFLLKFK